MGNNNNEIYKIGDNITLFNENFGDFMVDVVCDLLGHVDIWLTDALGLPHFSSKQVVILKGEHPKCIKMESFHKIQLNTKRNYWCQWVYQFAHEYCHHLIDGGLTGKIDGLIWFEETICEVSSMFCLHRMVEYCSSQTNPYLRRYHLPAQDYLDDLLKREEDDTPLHLYVQRNLPLLEQSQYHREIYRYIAQGVFPLFVACPPLWKTILHFGNMHEQQSLTLLFEHLKAEADTTYADALQRLRMLLLGS